jgi:RND superfamily putative drug exporter
MLGLAVAIGYALFTVFHCRHELADGRDPQEAAGSAVVIALTAIRWPVCRP